MTNNQFGNQQNQKPGQQQTGKDKIGQNQPGKTGTTGGTTQLPKDKQQNQDRR